MLPPSVAALTSTHAAMKGKTTVKVPYEAMYLSTMTPDQGGEPVFVPMMLRDLPLFYAPPALAMAFGRATYTLLGLTRHSTAAADLYFGRFGNLVYYIGAVALAIRVTPVLKTTLAALALMPMALSLAASPNRDVSVIVFVLMFVALALRAIVRGREHVLTTGDLWLLAAATVLLVLSKLVYSPLFLLLALVPASSFGDARRKWRTLGLLAAAGVAGYGASSLILRLYTGSPLAAASGPAGEQLAWVLAHPGEYLGVLGSTLADYRFAFFPQFVADLGWLDTNFPLPFTVLVVILLVGTAVADRSGAWWPDLKARVAFLVVAALSVVMVETALYLQWTSVPAHGGVGAPAIVGPQGRYFIPIAPAVLCALRSRSAAGLAARLSPPPHLLLAVFCSWHLLALAVLLLRYYVQHP
jgi:uncharacterized membrane protein